MKMKILSLLFILLAVTADLYSAEAVFLKDGKIIYGTVVSDKNNSITISEEKTKKKFEFERNQILRINYNVKAIKQQFIYKKDKNYIKGFIVDEDANFYFIRKDLYVNDEMKISKTDIASIADEEIAVTKKYIMKYKGKAKSVVLEGDFTGWQPEPMTKNGDTWEKTLNIDILKKEEYSYRYIIDGSTEKQKKIKFKLKNNELVQDIDKYKFTIGASAGYPFYAGGHASRFEAQKPLITVSARTNLPFIWERLAFQFESSYMMHKPVPDINPVFDGMNVETTNLFFGGFLVIDFRFFDDSFGIHPKIGGGYVYQNTVITGSNNETTQNGFPYLGYGLDLKFFISESVELTAGYQVWSEFENKTITHVNAVMIGAGYKPGF